MRDLVRRSGAIVQIAFWIERQVSRYLCPVVAHNARTIFDHGYTSAFSGGANRPQIEVKLRDEIAAGYLPGPRIKASSFERAVESIHEVFGRSAVPVQLPMGAEKAFSGVIDIVRMRAYCYKPGTNGKGTETDIPSPYEEAATKAHETLVEMVAEGKIEIGMVNISQILTTPGVDLVGPLPAGIQSFIVFSGGVSANSKAPDAARDLMKFFKSGAVPVIKAQGMEPG